MQSSRSRSRTTEHNHNAENATMAQAGERSNESEIAPTEKPTVFFYIPCVALAVIKNKFNSKRAYSLYSKIDRSQLLTIACSQEQEKRNKIIAQAGA